MKQYQAAIVVLICLLAFGCQKGEGDLPKPQPTISWTITPIDSDRKDTAWYGDIKTVSYSTTNATSLVILGVSTTGVSGSFQTPGLTASKTYTATVTGDGGTINSAITIPVYSERMTTYCKGKYWENTYLKAYRVDSPAHYHEPPTFSGMYYYYPNGAGKLIILSGVSAGTYSNPPGSWYFMDNETKIYRGLDNIWIIDTLTATKLVEHQDQIVAGKLWKKVAVWQAY